MFVLKVYGTQYNIRWDRRGRWGYTQTTSRAWRN
jgi:hypothetical protein